MSFRWTPLLAIPVLALACHSSTGGPATALRPAQPPAPAQASSKPTQPPSEPQPAPSKAPAEPPQPTVTDLQTVAERTNFKATARYDDVVALLDALAKSSPLAKRAEMGKTGEGRSIPMLIISDPPVATPEEATEQARKGKLIVLAIGNIHAGEVDGKEALPILAREILAEKDHPLLKHLVLIFAPIYNADGNERFAKTNRPGQVGPEEGMGIRENAAGLDLNRDFVKLEAPETRALVRAFNQWDPHLFIDTHTTNGSYHRYIVTYETPRNIAGNAGLIAFARDTMMPAVAKAMDEKYNRKVFPYGDFNKEHTQWSSFESLARYGTNYFGLRNGISVLSEGYSYATYKDRVLGTRDFVKAVLEYAAENKDTVKKAITEAENATVSAGREPPKGDKPEELVAIRSKAVAAPEKATALGFVEKQENGKAVNTGESKDYQVDLMTRFEPTLTVKRPFGYILPPDRTQVIENLQRHGIEVEEFREDIELDVEAYEVVSVARATREFQKHSLLDISVTPRTDSRSFKAGTSIVRTGQKLGNLAVYLLEPACDDGLAAWNFFDDALSPGKEFPVLRVPQPTPILSTRVRALAEDRPAPDKPKPITYHTAYEPGGLPSLSGSPTSVMGWLDDGEHYVQNREGKVRKVNALTGRSEVFFDPDPIAKALAAIPTIKEKTAGNLANRAFSSMNKDRSAAFFNHENDLYYAKTDGSAAARLTSTPEPEELVTFSPDGVFLAFVRKFDLYVVDLQTRTERALTTGGTENIRHGIADWVYEEEIYGRGAPRTYWWSPDSSRIAFLRIDNSMVRTYTIVNELPTDQVVEHYKYPRPGEPNPVARLGVVTVAGSGPFWAEMADYEENNHLITSVSWWPDSSQVYCVVQNRIQSWADVCALPAGGGTPTKLFRDSTKAWVDTPPQPKFLKDGSFLFASERTGFRHFYHYAKDGTLIRPITSGQWEVRGLHSIDEDNKFAYFNGTADSPIASNLYRVKLDGGTDPAAEDGCALERLTPDSGNHSVSISPKFNLFVDTWSSRTQPAKVMLRKTLGEPARTLDTNPVYALDDYRFGKSEQFQIAMKDGFPVEGAWVLPSDFDPAKKYGVWFMTYAGPQAPSISDSWGGGQVFDNALASAGIVAFRADPRSASGKGAQSAWTSYKEMGVGELKDIVETMDWLKSQPWVDGSKIGMSGYSYGGFMTAYAMTHSDAFAAGIAGGSVTDWREYDTLYTERFMSTPQENPDGYDRTSVNKAAKNLHGRLMLVHGTIDENVHPANSWKLVRALQQAGKQFDQAFYPGVRHGVGGAQYQRLQYDFITRWVGPEAAPQIETPTQSPPPDSLAGRRGRSGRRGQGAAREPSP